MVRRNVHRVSMGALFGFVPCLIAHCTRRLGRKQHYCRQGYFSLPPLSVSVARARCWIRFISVIFIRRGEIQARQTDAIYTNRFWLCYLVGRLVTTVHLYLPGPILAHVGGIGTAHEGDNNLFCFFILRNNYRHFSLSCAKHCIPQCALDLFSWRVAKAGHKRTDVIGLQRACLCLFVPR